MLILITMFLLTMLMLIQIGWMLTPSPHLSLSNSFHISQQIISMSQNMKKHFYQCDVQCLKCSSKYAINIVGNELVFSDCLLVPQTSEYSQYKSNVTIIIIEQYLEHDHHHNNHHHHHDHPSHHYCFTL